MFGLLFILFYGLIVLIITWIIVLPKINIERENEWLVERLEELEKIYKSKEEYKKAMKYDNESLLIVGKYSTSKEAINDLIEKRKTDEITYNSYNEKYSKLKEEILILVEKDKKLQKHTNKEIRRIEYDSICIKK